MKVLGQYLQRPTSVRELSDCRPKSSVIGENQVVLGFKISEYSVRPNKVVAPWCRLTITLGMMLHE